MRPKMSPTNEKIERDEEEERDKKKTSKKALSHRTVVCVSFTGRTRENVHGR